MAITWTVEVLAPGQENAQVVDSGAADTEQEASAAARLALMASARERGRCEFWVAVGGSALLVVPGLDDAGQADVAGLRDALDLLSSAGTA